MQVSNCGLWLFIPAAQREYYLSFKHFPWFGNATIQQLSAVEVERGHILRWVELDVDLDLERIEHPQNYPLVSSGSGRLLRVSDSRKPTRKKASARA
jgi:hypothetical protein